MDLSIPYDAAARLAYEKAGSKGNYEDFKANYEKEAVAQVIAKKKARDSPGSATPSPAPSTMDLSIPYDAAARLAYEKAGSKGNYEEFKAKYEKEAVAQVIAKKKARDSA
jgi:UDP:flavonoid glycosyltransferase YjiC (YdhE family)